MAIIKCSNLCFSYDEKTQILRNINLEIKKGQLLTLLGPNGVGKSTLLNCLTGLLVPNSGSVYLNSRDIFSLSRKEIAKQIAYVPQKTNVPFDYTVKEFVVMGRTAHLGLWSTPASADYEIAENALEKLEILHLSERPINELSGGEQQKVCIARALAQEPKVVILDEPTSALDYGNQIRVLNLIGELLDLGYAVLQTTHNPDHCLMLGGTVAILDQNGDLVSGVYDDIMTEERLSNVYRTKLKLVYIEELNRKTCVPCENPKGSER